MGEEVGGGGGVGGGPEGCRFEFPQALGSGRMDIRKKNPSGVALVTKIQNKTREA